MSLEGERQRIENAAKWYLNEELGIDRRLIRYRYETMRPVLTGRYGLELGSAEGVMTEMLAPHFLQLTVVEGSLELVSAIPSLANTEVICSLFENFEPERLYDVIVADHVLEHVEDPGGFLESARGWIGPGGRMVIGVPNGNSIHRLAAVKMGMLASPTALNERDVAVGHRRVYTKESLLAEIASAGLVVAAVWGVFLKPLSNSQIEATWSPAMMDGFYELGKEFPDLCAELLVVAHW